MFKSKAIAALIVALVIVVGFVLRVPALRPVLLAVVVVLLAAAVVGVIIALGLRAWHARKPVKNPEEESIKLHLND